MNNWFFKMHDMKTIHNVEYQKCGEILVATKMNTLVIVCNICQQMFIQLQAFMRHLQYQHNDKIKFIKQPKEVEVYAVEELMNQNVASVAIEANVSTLDKEELKPMIGSEKACIENVIEPSEKEKLVKETNLLKLDQKNEHNFSILKALEDCDVSFSFIDDLNNIKCSEEESKLGNTFLQQIQKDWEHSDSDENTSHGSICNNSEILERPNSNIDLNKQLQIDDAITEHNINSTSLEGHHVITKRPENSPIKCIRNLLHGIEDLDDVDSLLEHLESNVSVIEKICNNVSPGCNFNDHADGRNCLDTEVEEKRTNFNEDIPKGLVENTNLKELEEALDKDMNSNVEIETKTIDYDAPIDTLQTIFYKPNNLPKKSADQKTFNAEKHDINKNGNNSTEIPSDFDQQAMNLNCSLLKQNTSYMNKDIDSVIPLNDDLKKALADVLGSEDLELLNMEPEDEIEGLLNEEIKDLLKIPKIKEKENLKISSPKDGHTIATGKPVKILIKHPNSHSNNFVSKYRITNLKARKRGIAIQHTKLLNPINCLALKENPKACYSEKSSLSPFKGNTENENIQKPIPVINNLNSSPKTLQYKSILEQIRTPTKENQENINSLLILGNIIEAKPIGLFNYINTTRGDKTPEKSNQLFLDVKAKSKESGEELTKHLPPKHRGRSHHKRMIRKRRKIQDNHQYTNPNIILPQIAQLKITHELKNPPKLIHNIAKTTTTDNSVLNREQKNKSPLKHLSNEKQASPTKTHSHLLHSDAGIPPKNPTRLRNVAIKLHRITPDKILRQCKNEATKPCVINTKDMDTKQIADYFKIPKGISLQVLPKKQASPKNQQPETVKPLIKTTCTQVNYTESRLKITQHEPPEDQTRMEETTTYGQQNFPESSIKITQNQQPEQQSLIADTPVKTIIDCQQNFSESSKKSAQHEVTEQKSLIETPINSTTFCKQNFLESSSNTIETKSSHMQAQHETIKDIQPKENVSKTRQHKASLNTVSSNKKKTKTNISHTSANKSPPRTNLDFKSYAINRSARKKEIIQRIHNIKKQIFKSIEEDKSATKVQNIEPPQKNQYVVIENVQILPKIADETMLPLMFNNLNCSQTATTTKTISSKTSAHNHKKPQILSNRVRVNLSIKQADNSTKKSLKRLTKSSLVNKNKQAKHESNSPAQNKTTNAENIPELETTQLGLSESAVGNLQHDLKENHVNVESFLNGDSPSEDGKLEKTSTELNARDELLQESKKAGYSPRENGTLEKTTTELNVRDELIEESKKAGDSPRENGTLEKTTKELNARDKLIEESKKAEDLKDCNIVDEILKQVDNEGKMNKLSIPSNVEDFDAGKDIALLANFGLNIVKFPDIENDISLEESEEMKKKALKFSSIYNFYSRIWSTRNSGTPTFKHDLDQSFKLLLNDLKQSFDVDLSISELKRLINLLNAWYIENFNNKLLKKQRLPDNTWGYLLIFNYIPKTNMRFRYCEFCDECFTAENKYSTHRIMHTRDNCPYKCLDCGIGFNTTRTLKYHQNLHKSSSHETKTPPSTNEITKSQENNCPVCSKKFITSKQLYEHSKSHLKTIYNCAKCDLVFASAIDVKYHMAMCNTLPKCTPKQCTPRPLKSRSQRNK